MNSIKDVEKLALFRIQESVIPADKEIDTVDIELAEKDIQLPSFDLEQSIVTRCRAILQKEKDARDADAAREAHASALREQASSMNTDMSTSINNNSQDHIDKSFSAEKILPTTTSDVNTTPPQLTIASASATATAIAATSSSSSSPHIPTFAHQVRSYPNYVNNNDATTNANNNGGSHGAIAIATEIQDPFEALQVSREASNGSFDGEEFDRRQKMILEMMSQTSLEQDVCVFYLESTEWDLNKALEFVKSMS